MFLLKTEKKKQKKKGKALPTIALGTCLHSPTRLSHVSIKWPVGFNIQKICGLGLGIQRCKQTETCEFLCGTEQAAEPRSSDFCSHSIFVLFFYHIFHDSIYSFFFFFFYAAHLFGTSCCVNNNNNKYNNKVLLLYFQMSSSWSILRFSTKICPPALHCGLNASFPPRSQPFVGCKGFIFWQLPNKRCSFFTTWPPPPLCIFVDLLVFLLINGYRKLLISL